MIHQKRDVIVNPGAKPSHVENDVGAGVEAVGGGVTYRACVECESPFKELEGASEDSLRTAMQLV